MRHNERLGSGLYTNDHIADPTGPLRLITCNEALNGLLFIARSTSYTYLAMERF